MNAQFLSGLPFEAGHAVTTDILDRIVKWRRLKNDLHTTLRLLYLECRRNLELLGIVELDKTDGIPTSDEDFRTIILCLETEILEMVFLEGEKNRKMYELLRRKLKINELDDEEEKGNGPVRKVSVIYAIVFLYVKIHTLKKIALMEKKGKALRKIYFRARLRNIKENMLNILEVLAVHKEIREIIREEE